MNNHPDSGLLQRPASLIPPEMRPVVGITTNHEDIDATLRDRYYKQIAEAGATPVLIPPVDHVEVISSTLDRIDALLLSGGGDCDPKYMGEEPWPTLGNVNAERDHPELLMTMMAADRQMPILGICRGMQMMAVALGGHVVQDLYSAKCRAQSAECGLLQHSQKEERDVTTHEVGIQPDSILYHIYDQHAAIQVNSFHHQAVDNTGVHFQPVAFAPDGVIEAMESTEHKPWMAVQWHPEWLGQDGQPIFQWLAREAKCYAKAKRIHSQILTLDTHCDTPMFFDRGADFSRRDPLLLVDAHKMTEGQVDAVTMVAYLPQTLMEDTNLKDIEQKELYPCRFADKIFDRIEQIVSSHPDYLALARTPEEMWRNKHAGKKSVVLGIENGLALGTDPERLEEQVRHFAQRGITYITLCHNGDNLLCDSARRSNHTWGGLSPYGRRVVAEMNRQGLLVDLSHASESSFYDALEASQTPVVCSHSNCRALCDHPRNLTDEQLRRLAQRGGLCHITLYGGFLKTSPDTPLMPGAGIPPTEATLLDAVQHLDHAIRIMGIEHVGLGTDFDGDGGIPGFAHAGEALNFTRQLLLRRYSPQDIERIWGGNWLRLMEKIQKKR